MTHVILALGLVVSGRVAGQNVPDIEIRITIRFVVVVAIASIVALRRECGDRFENLEPGGKMQRRQAIISTDIYIPAPFHD